MNQGKIIVGIAILLGISAGLAGYWWNYRVGHRAMQFWGQENARLIRLAPKVELLRFVITAPALPNNADKQLTLSGYNLVVTESHDLSQARGLIHLRNALLSDDQFQWEQPLGEKAQHLPRFGLRFSDADGKSVLVFIVELPSEKLAGYDEKRVLLGPLAKSLEQFLARELPRAEQEAATKQATPNPNTAQPAPAKSE